MNRFAAVPPLAVVCALGLTACVEAGNISQNPSPSPDRAARIRSVEEGLIPGDVPDGTPPGAASLRDRMSHYRVPGVSVAVIEGGRIDWARGYGVEEAGGSQQVDTATLFQAASISKVVTTIAALRLVDAGRLSLDGDVNANLTRWRVPENSHTQEQKVTLRQILTHTGGLTVSGFAGYERGQPVPTLLQVLTGSPPANSPAVQVDVIPGSTQRYSGGGFTVLQLLVSEATGLPFEAALDELVLRPADMIHSTFEQPLPPSLEAQAAAGHSEHGSPVEGGWRIHPEKAAAGLWSTPSDLARLVIAIHRAAADQEGGLLSGKMAREMVSPQVGPSGLGFVVLGDGEHRIFRHSGSNVGFRARMVAYVQGGRGAVVMTNGDSGFELIEEILASIARTYDWPTAD